ncbi:hypothetical protein HHI36_006013 [Cryptolaemus montrouzieri]|uniref:Uncharacterized protein n=1 Tax=Cryptolaemus montrouzieri TaxID=559131 RepID=A0ABD2NWS3_9CUCU
MATLKPWVPNIVCKLCNERSRQWATVELHGINKRKMIYPDLLSAKRPHLYSDDVLSPMSQGLSDLSDLSDTEMVDAFSDERDSDFEVSPVPSLFFLRCFE